MGGDQHSRREFLLQSATIMGTVVAAAAISPLAAAAQNNGAAPAAAPPPKRSIKKAVGIGMINAKSMLDKFRLAKQAGLEGVEIDSPGNFKIDEVLAARDSTGVQVCTIVDSVHWNQTLGDPDPQVRAAGLDGLRKAMRDCKSLGATSVLLVPAVVNKSISYAEAYARSQEEIRKAIPLAEELGIRIGIENVWNNFLMSPLEAARYVDEFNSPAVGWHFDIGNIVAWGWPEQWIRTLGRRIVKLHIKEYSRKKRDDQGLWKGFDAELMEGDIDWAAVMKALDEIGYKGWAAAEVNGGGLSRLKFLSQRMEKILAS